MEARPSPKDIDDLLSDATIEGLRASPGFRQACERAAAAAVAHFQSLDGHHRWITKDLGRISICLTALILYATEEGLTAQSLIAACRFSGVASSGRVLQIVRRCEAAGDLEVAADGPALWTRRRMTLSGTLLRIFRHRARLDLEAMTTLAPEVRSILDRFDDNAFFLRYVWHVGLFTAGRDSLGVFTPRSPTYLFLEREAGMLMLFDLLGAQAADRERLLEAAPISRYALSGRYDVSRVHINKMLADAAAAGLLTCPATDRVAFSPTLSDGLERQYAFLFQLSRAAGLASLAATASGHAAPL